MSKFDKAILVLTLLTLIFGSIWSTMIFMHIDPDGIKDITLELSGALITLITVRVIQKYDPTKDEESNKKD